MMLTAKVKALICTIVIASLICAGVVYAAYLMTSNNTSGTVGEQADIQLTLSPTSITLGSSWTLSATVTDHAAGVTITFKEGTTTLGTGVTNSNGIALLTFAPTTVGAHTYVAEGTHP
jgi:hypothetical protein